MNKNSEANGDQDLERITIMTGVIVFTKSKDGDWYVLCTRVKDYDGEQKWCVCGSNFSCGKYATLDESMVRNFYKSTGMVLSEYKKNYTYYGVNSDCGRIEHYYYNIVDDTTGVSFTIGEETIIDKIGWVKMNCLNNLNWMYTNQPNVIRTVYNNRIAIPWWKKCILKLYNKYLCVC